MLSLTKVFFQRQTYLSLKFFHVLTSILPILAISRFRPYVDTVIIIPYYSDVLLYFQGGYILGFHRGFWLQRTHCIDFLLKRKSPVVATVQILDIKASLSLSIGTVLLQVWQVGEVEMGGGSREHRFKWRLIGSDWTRVTISLLRLTVWESGSESERF